MHHYEFFGGGWMMIFWWILIIVLAMVLFGAFFRNRQNTAGSEDQSESALDILKKRYANGDITKEEFEEKKKDLLN